jgi:hypothetical protein
MPAPYGAVPPAAFFGHPVTMRPPFPQQQQPVNQSERLKKVGFNFKEQSD